MIAVVVQSLSHIQLFATPWTVAYQAPLSMEFPRQEYGVSCHFLLQGIFPAQGSNPCLLHWQTDLLPMSHQGSPILIITYLLRELKFHVYNTVLNLHCNLHLVCCNNISKIPLIQICSMFQIKLCLSYLWLKSIFSFPLVNCIFLSTSFINRVRHSRENIELYLVALWLLKSLPLQTWEPQSTHSSANPRIAHAMSCLTALTVFKFYPLNIAKLNIDKHSNN